MSSGTRRKKIIENALDIEMADISTANFDLLRRQLVNRSGIVDTFSQIVQELWQSYQQEPEPEFAEWELIPRLCVNHVSTYVAMGASSSLPVLSARNLKRTLMYAHTLVVPDPFLSAAGVWDGVFPELHLRETAFLNALHFWINFRELIDAEIIVTVPEYPLPGPLSVGKVHDAAERDDRYVSAFVELFPEVTPAAPENLPYLGGPLDDEGVGRVSEVLMDLQDVLWASRTSPGCDSWFHSRSHLGLVLLLADYGLKSEPAGIQNLEKMTALLDLEIPAVEDIATRDIIRIRQESDVFDAWRGEVSTALAALSDAAERGVSERGQLRELQVHMSGVAAKAARDIYSAKKDAAWTAARSLTFGAIASGAGSLIDGLLGAVSGAVGGAVAAVLEISRDNLDLRRRLSARNSFRRHAIAISEGPADHF